MNVRLNPSHPLKIEKGDVVQINPETATNPQFGAALLVVDEVRAWGVQGYVVCPGSGQAWYRAKWEEIEYVGKAVWVEGEASPPTTVAVDIEAIAKALYDKTTDSDTMHCNRFPSWGELTTDTREYWRNQAKVGARP